MLNRYEKKSYLVYLDDITILSKTNDQHRKDIEDIIVTPYAACVSSKLKKATESQQKKNILAVPSRHTDSV